MANFQIMQNSKIVGEVTLKDDITGIGRNIGSQVCLQHSKVSGTHAQVVKEKGAFWLEDLGSTNGTYVSGKKITSQYRLHHGDEVAIGEHTLKFISIGSEEHDTDIVEGDNHEAESTMMINAGQLKDMLGTHELNSAAKQGKATGWLEWNGQEVPLSRTEVIIGKSANADVAVKGFFAPAVSASVIRTRDG
ncbi:MAG: FHA domain-containing protein, partial [Methylococcales bacterium]|nr:FHA domain-containing protein [Methylococcales bacterium]